MKQIALLRSYIVAWIHEKRVPFPPNSQFTAHVQESDINRVPKQYSVHLSNNRLVGKEIYFFCFPTEIFFSTVTLSAWRSKNTVESDAHFYNFQPSLFHALRMPWRTYLVLDPQALNNRNDTPMARRATRIHVAMPKLCVFTPTSLPRLLLFLLSHLPLSTLYEPLPLTVGGVLSHCVLPLVVKSAEIKHPYLYRSYLFKSEWKLCLLFLKKQYYKQFW